MGVRPTQGDEIAFRPTNTLHGSVTLPLVISQTQSPISNGCAALPLSSRR
jgi:hypothetical protein